ncbi:MAG: aspartate kinase [Polyangiaceae bacterium]|nr:aspartate kinase [Polyangiaceae bacterium]
MAIIVQKYGGSSVADLERLGRVADKVVAAKRAGHDVVVTVSAMGKTTDGLLELARKASTHDGTPHDAPRRELDMLVSTGERVSMSLLCIAIAARGESAISFTGSQSGIITNDRHFDARIIEVRPHRIEDELSRGRIVIVAGYQGMSYRREITTLGRGGTDTTAVALAAALGADRCEIYSDVDGVYSADPRSVADARHLPAVGYETLQEMAECGAKVLNAQAVEWARKARITIAARSTFDTWETSTRHRQTLVGPDAAEGPGAARVRAIVAEKNLVYVRVRGGDALGRVVHAAAAGRVPLRDLHWSDDGGAFVVPLLNVPDWRDAEARLRAAGGDHLTLETGLASTAVVGGGLSTEGEPLARFARTVAEVAPFRHLVATPLRLSALVDATHAPDLERRLHRDFTIEDA